MSLIDFLFEAVLEFVVFVVVLMSLGMSPMAFISFCSLGMFNTVVVHSGYDIPFLPDPYPHYLHHKTSKVNFSIGLMDYILNTSK
jgi:sterol desaturase/sphingolipid hydroxylase (fatty acid hydroxylase superfamily)